MTTTLILVGVILLSLTRTLTARLETRADMRARVVEAMAIGAAAGCVAALLP
jgi:hypothetical protein